MEGQSTSPRNEEGDWHVTELTTAWDVDRRIVVDSAEKVVLVRFSSYTTPPDEVVFSSSGLAPSTDGGEEDEADDAFLDALDDIGGGRSSKKRSRGHHSSRQPPSSRSRKEPGAASPSSLAGSAHYLATQQMDAMLHVLAPKVRKFCKIFTVDTTRVTEFNSLYELGHEQDPFAVMFFYRNTHIKIDVGTGNTNRINFFAFEDWKEFVPLIEAVYRAGRLGKHMTASEKSYSLVAVQR